ncbi:TBC1 domain family member 5 [Sarotherodon galilaeus]
MATDPLGEAGFYFDELNKLRVLEPDVSQKTSELKEECKEFVDKIGQFQKIVGGLIELVDELAKEAETEKMKAIGARNLLTSVAKQREAQQQQLQALIAEKKMQLERELLRCSSFSEAVPKLRRHGPPLTACCSHCGQVCAFTVQGASSAHLCWHQMPRHVTPTLKMMELFIQREPIYTIYTLVCISSFITFCINGD